MKRGTDFPNSTQYRRQLAEWYDTPYGCRLKELESEYLATAISFRYNQRILQIGSVGWENDYRQRDCNYHFLVVDTELLADSCASRVLGNHHELPFDSESMDVVVVPHGLEFGSDPRRILREGDRVLKPEGQLIVLGFNPWCLQNMARRMQRRRGIVPWCGSFLSCRRLRDWLLLLNFDTAQTATTFFHQRSIVSQVAGHTLEPIVSVGYGIKAIKRRYNLIPLSPIKAVSKKLIPADLIPSRYRARG